MRVARYFPMVALTGLLYLAAMPFSARAWNSWGTEATDQPSEPQPTGRIVDGAVQQAGYYDSRPQPNSTTISSPDNSMSNRNGALFRGEPLHFPKLPFGRRTSPNQSANYKNSQPAPNQERPNNAAQVRPRAVNQSAAVGHPMQQRAVNNAQPAAGNSNFQNPRNIANRQPLPIHQGTVPNPMPLGPRSAAVPTHNNNTSPVSPWTTTPAIAAVGAPVAVAGAVAVAAPAKPAISLSPADRLVGEAHAASSVAKTEQDYTRIIETCRRAQASQASAETAKYAKNLTAWALNRRGQLKAEASRDKDAILDFDDAIRTDTTCWRAIHNRGVLLAQAGRFEKAFDDFSRTIQLNPQFAKAYTNRAALFMVANNLNAALQDYNRAIELDANLAVAHRGCGRVCQLLGKLDEANQHYDAAVQLAPNDAYAAACRADLLTDIGHYSDALAEYNRALAIDPKSSQANCGSAWLLATCPDNSLRNPQLAVERAKHAIELSGQKDAINFDSLAAAQASAGDFTAAIQSIHKAIELAPADERATYKDRLLVYQKAKPYRIAPIERVAQQASFQTR
jgi:tetratricopeptide (TPR) repeat protein